MKRTHKIGILALLMLSLAMFLIGCQGNSGNNPVNEMDTPQPIEAPNRLGDLPAPPEASLEAGGHAQLQSPADTIISPLSSEFVVYFLDVGQGAAAFVICDGATMLIDGGDASASNLIYSFLDRNGIDHMDYIVNTHPHADHVGGLAGALNRISSVGAVLGSAEEYETRAFESFARYLAEHGAELEIPNAGETFMLGSATVEILAPLREYDDENNNSIILKITYGETGFMFKGDAERESETDLVESGVDLSATVLKVSHHGSETSTSYPFLRAVMPEIAIISVGANNRYGHPHDTTLSRLRDAGVTIYRTDLQGDIIIRSDGVNLTVETQRNAYIPTNPTEQVVEEITHIGNTNSKKFHRPDCHTLPAEHNRVHLETREHAIDNGFEPCGNCKP